MRKWTVAVVYITNNILNKAQIKSQNKKPFLSHVYLQNISFKNIRISTGLVIFDRHHIVKSANCGVSSGMRDICGRYISCGEEMTWF